jgi:MraZ protein
MINFLGEYEVTLDAKGRFSLPAGFRKQLPEGSPESFVINRGFENCLTLYPLSTWKELEEKISKLNDFNPKVRDFKRLFLNGATPVEADSAGRLLVTKSQKEYARIDKDMVFSSQGNKVEIWDRDTYYKYIQSKAESFADLASEVLGGGIINPLDQLTNG